MSLPTDGSVTESEIESYFAKYPITRFLYSQNSGLGEVDGLYRFVETQDLTGYDILTYMHCKGVTKPGHEHIFNWTKLMRYFVIEKMDVCEKAFKKGYATFGANKGIPDHNMKHHFVGSNFIYEGNFVSINLHKITITKAVLDTYLDRSYYGVEALWGKLCRYEEGYTVFNSGLNHYNASVPEKLYTTRLGRARYNLMTFYYRMRKKLLQ
ncbi:hypothetical protein [Hymenobacter pini]|uniref:hypothetical protein n=1 Tax=Hymenobacter pini TaxID=2880879 RepID=UPI001CF33027|nr:hypothetical protein [Hymenobacter pini]MCA8833419.1 hypothetical protein [Hymenobacter pini]